MALRRAICHLRTAAKPLLCGRIRSYSSTSLLLFKVPTEKAPHTTRNEGIHPDQLEQLLAEPAWSIESLLPPKNRDPDAPKITTEKLHHLLRLSALPLPRSLDQEQRMLDTLAAQLHFVGKIQQLDTTGVEPLRAIRDESAEAVKEQELTVHKLRNAFESEECVGSFYRRIHRTGAAVDATEAEDWNVLGSAERKRGRFFVVGNERTQE